MSRVTPLSYSQVFGKEPGYPYLKAKAAQTRHLVGFCLTLARLQRAGNETRSPFAFKANHRLADHSRTHGDLLVRLFEGLSRFVTSCSADVFDADVCRDGMY